MAINLLTYKEYDPDLFKSVDIDLGPYRFEALDASNKSFTISKGDDGVLKEPENLYSGQWNFKIRVRRDICITNAAQLYGEYGLLPIDARIGICIIWTSSDSMQRGVFDLGVVDYEECKLDFHLDETFECKSSLAGRVTFALNFYVKEISTTPTPYQANRKGMLIGEIDSTYFLFDGSVEFPIVSVHNTRKQPLWDVDCHWEDIHDSFLDTVSVHLNIDHALFRYIDKTSDFYDINLVREILAGALLQIIEKYREADHDFSQLDNATSGSVADYVRFYLKGWNIKDISSLSAISRGIRKKLEEKFA